MPIRIDACVAQHQGDRKEQQDRVSILSHPRRRGIALAVVADGMGGYAGGSLAAEQVMHTARSSLEHFSPGEDIAEKMLETSMLEAHTMIRASRFINEKEPHSTAVMLLIQPDRLTWGHCGDSRLYRFHGRALVERTLDHSYVEHLVASGRITREEALSHANRNVLMTSLGGAEAPRIDFGASHELRGGDSFLLCSDGLWAYFTEEELGLLLAGHSARQACEIMIDEARRRARGGGDNVSLAVIKFIDEPAPPPSPSSFRR